MVATSLLMIWQTRLLMAFKPHVSLVGPLPELNLVVQLEPHAWQKLGFLNFVVTIAC